MKKAIYISLLALCLCACSVSNDSGKVSTTTAVTTTKAENSAATDAEDTVDNTFAVGETWEVEGQWKLTVTGVQETGERNQYSEKKPAAVYIVSCEYENLGYEDSSGIMSGLVFSLDESIVDSERYMGYNYPATIVDFPQETPIGAKCKAQYCIGVDNAGDFKLNVEKYDSSNTKQTAVFEISTKGIVKINAEDDTDETTADEEKASAAEKGVEWTLDKYISYPVCYADKNVYSEPDKDSKQLGFVTKGDNVTCIGKTDDKKWIVIEWKDDIGFIGASDVHE